MVGLEVGVGVGVVRSASEGDGIATDCPVAWSAVAAAGMKYAKPPAPTAKAVASAARKMDRKGLRRRRDALARCPGLIPSGTGRDSTRPT